jgi:hypothetical protein
LPTSYGKLLQASCLVFLLADGVSAQSMGDDGGITLTVPKALTWTEGNFSEPDGWQAMEPWVKSLEQKSGSEVSTAEQLFRLLEQPKVNAPSTETSQPIWEFSPNLVGQVTIERQFASPDSDWVAVERALGLDAIGSARVRLAMQQIVPPSQGLPSSTEEFQDFTLKLDPEKRELLNRAIFPQGYIIDEPSFVPVVFPQQNGTIAEPILLVSGGGSDSLGNTGGEFDFKATPAQKFERLMIAATVYMVGKQTAQSRITESDGSISFPNRQTFHKALFGDNRLCPTGIQAYDTMREFREIEVLAGCGAVIVKDSKQRPWLMTAGHCADLQGNADELLLLSDRVVDGSLQEMANKPPQSSAYRVIKPFPKKHKHPSAEVDLVLLELPQDMIDDAISLPDRDSEGPFEGQSVTALTFPLGLPLNFVQGKDTVVSRVESDRFWARIDNFANSSGAPVFTDWGELTGILVRQPNPLTQNLDIWEDNNCFVPRVERSTDSETARFGAIAIDARLANEIIDSLN